MDWAAYNAARIRAHYSGENIISVEGAILSVLRSDHHPWKREEIIDQVSIMTHIDKDSLSAHINGVLRNLESRGRVYHVSSGMWCIQ